MASRDNHLWLQLWRDRQTDFHQSTVNQLLIKFWTTFEHSKKSRVFVPLCGKSLDMIWLAAQGHEVIGIELSPVAVKAFFKENHLRPSKKRIGKFTIWKHGRISILCGDFFALEKADLGNIETVYDRAALTALPEDIRKFYVAQLRLIIPESSEVFLLTTEDAEKDQTLAQALGIAEEVKALYASDFDIHLAHVESVYENNSETQQQEPARIEYKVYRLAGKRSSNLM